MIRIYLAFSIIFSSLTILAQDAGWEFHYPGDIFTEDALLDLRYLNEDFAGEHGFIILSEDGESFRREDGEPIRFWAVNGGDATRNMSDEELAFHARFLAKMGINMNRFHASVNPPGKGYGLFDVDTVEVDRIWRFVAAMKKEGVYSTISPFWAHNGHMGGWIPEEWGLEGYQGTDDLWAVMYFNDRLMDAYKSWMRYLYTEPNPYTGIPLCNDPALAVIQIKNEDGVFWWTMQTIKPELKAMAGRLFFAWIEELYGSYENALESWGGLSLPGDKPDQGMLDLFATYDLSVEPSGRRAKRLEDQTHFLADRQRAFYDEIKEFYREELGCMQLINPNNWRTASPVRLNDLERYTYMGCDVPAVNRYYDPAHTGENNGWRIDPGHFYQGESCLKNIHKLPLNVKQLSGYPFIITESGWNFPNKFMSEAPALVACYQLLTGHDAFYWFSITSTAYNEFPYFGFTKDELGRYAMHRWSYSIPGGIAQFPAYALLFRQGYIQEGEVMIHEYRSLDQLWRREVPLISEETSFDPNRDEGVVHPEDSGNTEISPLAYLTGPIKLSIGADTAESFVNSKIEKLIDNKQGIVYSVTGELELNHKQGLFKFISAKAIGISGFLSADTTYVLGQLEITTDNDYLTLGVVSMDGRTLDSSSRILVQAGTTYLPTGWEEEAGTWEKGHTTYSGYKILNTGKMPWIACSTRVQLRLRNTVINRAVLLDLAGYPVKEIPLKRVNDEIQLILPPDCLYMVLTAEQ